MREVSRRRFFAATAAGAGMLAASTSLAGCTDAGQGASNAFAVSAKGDAQAQYGFLMNVQRCIDCKKCVEACRAANGTPESLPARRHITYFTDKYGIERAISLSCMHCEKPACMTVCPAGAITKEAGGIVVVNKERCIGCKYCYQACPFEAPHYDGVSMYKCDYCFGAGVALGDAPNCVRACTTQALKFGKLDDLLALSPRVRRMEGSTEPSAALV